MGVICTNLWSRQFAKKGRGMVHIPPSPVAGVLGKCALHESAVVQMAPAFRVDGWERKVGVSRTRGMCA